MVLPELERFHVAPSDISGDFEELDVDLSASRFDCYLLALLRDLGGELLHAI
jgi:hypothetical protein